MRPYCKNCKWEGKYSDSRTYCTFPTELTIKPDLCFESKPKPKPKPELTCQNCKWDIETVHRTQTCINPFLDIDPNIDCFEPKEESEPLPFGIPPIIANAVFEPKHNICKECKYYYSHDCRRHAPVAYHNNYSGSWEHMFPQVRSFMKGCGDFEPK